MEFMDWSQPWGDAAIDRSSRLADLIAAGNCSGGAALEIVRKLIVPWDDVELDSSSITDISPLHFLTINPTAGARYRIQWTGMISRVGTTNCRLNLYIYVDGVNAFTPYPISTVLVPEGEVHVNISGITDALDAGEQDIVFRYNRAQGKSRLRAYPGGWQEVYWLEAFQLV
jgi:hypothetical protein